MFERARPYADLTSEQLEELENRLYDDMVDGDAQAAFDHDQLMWEVNWRKSEQNVHQQEMPK